MTKRDSGLAYIEINTFPLMNKWSLSTQPTLTINEREPRITARTPVEIMPFKFEMATGTLPCSHQRNDPFTMMTPNFIPANFEQKSHNNLRRLRK